MKKEEKQYILIVTPQELNLYIFLPVHQLTLVVAGW